MNSYPLDIREEELKLRVAKDFFANYDTTNILGSIDFCVAMPKEYTLFQDEIESLVWAEAKQGNTQHLPLLRTTHSHHRQSTHFRQAPAPALPRRVRLPKARFHPVSQHTGCVLSKRLQLERYPLRPQLQRVSNALPTRRKNAQTKRLYL